MEFHRVRFVKSLARAATFISFLWFALPVCTYAQAGFDSWLAQINNRTKYGHCATEAAFEIATERQKTGISNIQVIFPTLQDSITSPSGRFKVYFDLNGANATNPNYAAYVAHIADTTYLLEIDTLGYPKPPYAFSDSTWHIYLVAMNGGKYGFTAPAEDNSFGLSPTGLQKYRAFITMDNSFSASTYPTHGLDAARITVFHEFHHIIQFGDYGYGQLTHDVNFREMTSVWMEMRSSPWITDYQQYLPAYFAHLSQSFMLADAQGYGQCIWMKFNATVFQDSIVKQFWTWYSNINANYLLAFDSVLAAYNSSFCEQYRSFGAGLLNLRTIYFDSPDLPVGKYSLDSLKVYPVSADTSMIMDPASLILLLHYPPPNSGKAFVIARNTDFSVIPTLNVHYNNAYSWTSDHTEAYCGGALDLPSTNVSVYPQPFVYSPGLGASANIYSSNSINKPISCILRIFDLNNSLIRHIETPPNAYGGNWFVSWDGLDDVGSGVPSGIYYYDLLTDGVKTQGKIAVIRK
ncbi:MAG TPA: hypothetical protein VEW28_01500 [Candidatus Kapabacteria bacterium]|nr:hypothetical protein [Candidatus Kapabacteria bacterium]